MVEEVEEVVEVVGGVMDSTLITRKGGVKARRGMLVAELGLAVAFKGRRSKEGQRGHQA